MRSVLWCAALFSFSYPIKYETLSNWHNQENKSEAMVELAKNPPRALFNALETPREAKSSVPALLAAGARVDIVDQVLPQSAHSEDKDAFFLFTICEWQMRHTTNSTRFTTGWQSVACQTQMCGKRFAGTRCE